MLATCGHGPSNLGSSSSFSTVFRRFAFLMLTFLSEANSGHSLPIAPPKKHGLAKICARVVHPSTHTQGRRHEVVKKLRRGVYPRCPFHVQATLIGHRLRLLPQKHTAFSRSFWKSEDFRTNKKRGLTSSGWNVKHALQLMTAFQSFPRP